MQLKTFKFLVLGLSFLMLTGCEDPFFESSPDMMPTTGIIGGYPSGYGKQAAPQHPNYQSNNPPASQGYSTNNQANSNNNVKKSVNTQSNNAAKPVATDSEPEVVPAPNSIPMIPDSVPLI